MPDAILVDAMLADPPVESDLRLALEGVRELVELVRAGGVGRVRLDIGRIHLEVDPPPSAAAPVAVAPPVVVAPALAAANGVGPATANAAAAAAPAEPARVGVDVLAPLVGVFYRSPAPGEPPFVEVGSRVEAGQQVAIVEAMKMMNAIVAPSAGVVSRIYPGDGRVVEFDQPLLTIEPS